ncbi:MAG: type IV secretory system conjugative DNA transfer family protein, partial [Clostridia bacterium]|nr:type IV secretory system conjugative DNA transfer family protein [Clostridia bacterium]
MTIDKKVIIANAPYVLFFWLGDKLGYSLRVFEGNKISAIMKGIAELFKSPLFSFNPIDMLIGVVTAVAIKGILYIRSKNAKKFRKGIEYGSARWGTAEDIKPFID